jgi:hypothetical protein
MILIEGLPDAIYIEEEIFDINADYQTSLKIITAFEDNELTQHEKCMVLVQLLYKEQPEDMKEAVLQGIKFLDCGEESGEGQAQEEVTRKYSFKQDDRYIFAAVDKVLNGRLSSGEFVHWWEFVMAFMELPEKCMMSRLIYLRTQKAKGKLSKEEKELYLSMKDIVDLQDEFSSEEQKEIDEFMRLLKGGS